MKARALALRTPALFVTLLAAVAFIAAPALAEVYTVKLTNGKTFLTRYQPREASFDPNLVTFTGDHGNLVAIDRAEIQSITSAVETKGYGLRINTTTIMLGYTANNGVVEGGQVSITGRGGQSFDIEQFVEPGQAGGGGVPVFGGAFGGGGPFFGAGGGGGQAPAAPQSTSPPPSAAPVDSGDASQ